MGKSTVTTYLEEKWRQLLPSWRIIVRLNLNFAQHYLQTEIDNQINADLSLEMFLKRFVPFLPIELLSRLIESPVKVIVLLDGLDEVSPEHRRVMIRILHSLLLSPKRAYDRKFRNNFLRRPVSVDSFQLEKVFLTTRPHLRGVLEYELGVTAHSLLPLTSGEQITFLLQEIPKLSQTKAETALNSLHSPSRSLMGNPLMLFLFAQLVKIQMKQFTGFNDLFQLYGRSVEAVHWLHVVEKENADPDNFQTGLRVRNHLEQSLPFYYAVAIADMKPRDAKIWPVVGELPEGVKREELLSFGLLTSSSPGNLQFLRKSFSEFFYAHFLTKPSTPVLQKDVLFRQIFLFPSEFKNVEEFLICALKERGNEFPAQRLLFLSMEWFSQSQSKFQVLRGFVSGRLFPLLGDEILSLSVDIYDPSVIEILIESSLLPYNSNVPQLLRWLSQRDSNWTRQSLLGLPASQTAQKLSDRKACLVIVLLCFDKESIARSLTEEEIRSALIACDKLVEVVSYLSISSQKCRQLVASQMGKEDLRKSMMTKISIEASIQWRDSAWWMAEVLTKDEILSLLTEDSSRVTDLVGSDPVSVVEVWGEEFLGDLLNFRFKFEQTVEGTQLANFVLQGWKSKRKTVFEGTGQYFALTYLWRRLLEVEDGVTVLREVLLRSQDSHLFNVIEGYVIQLCNENVLKYYSRNPIEKVVRFVNGSSVWGAFDTLPIEFLPFVIRYGSLQDVKSIFPPLEGVDHRQYKSLNKALFLSLVTDKTDNSFKYVASLIKTWLPHEDIFSYLFHVNVAVLREFATNYNFSQRDGNLPFVSEVSTSWDGYASEKISDSSSTYAVFMSKSATCNKVEDRKDLLVEKGGVGLRNSSRREVLDLRNTALKSLLLSGVVTDSFQRSERGHLLCKCRLQTLLSFFRVKNGTDFSWADNRPTVRGLTRVIVEIRLCCSNDEAPKECSDAIDLISSHEEQLRGFGIRSLGQLIERCPPYRTMREWLFVLETLLIVEKQPTSFIESKFFLKKEFENPVSPLLLLYFALFRKMLTRDIVEDCGWWPIASRLHFYRPPNGNPDKIYSNDLEFASLDRSTRYVVESDPVIFAVCFESLKFLEEVAWPSILSFKFKDGQTFAQYAIKELGENHEVTRFLQVKFRLPFYSKSNLNTISTISPRTVVDEKKP